MKALSLSVVLVVTLLAVSGMGEASPPCYDRACPEVYRPVCGSDGNTYDNQCVFNFAKCRDTSLTIAKQGECGPRCDIACPLHFDPVCGSDGKTYGNGCALNAERLCSKPDLYAVHNGECDT